jgi:FKBP-type peptidyl-prolyl cis-trans isomerase
MRAIRLLACAALLAVARATHAQSVPDSGSFAFAGVAFAPSLHLDLAHSTRVGAGVYVRDLEPGTGEPLAPGTMVTLQIAIRLPDGTTVDAGRDPITMRLLPGQLVAGLDAGLRAMRDGGRRQIVVPGRSAFGHAGRRGVPPDSPVVFEVRIARAG